MLVEAPEEFRAGGQRAFVDVAEVFSEFDLLQRQIGIGGKRTGQAVAKDEDRAGQHGEISHLQPLAQQLDDGAVFGGVDAGHALAPQLLLLFGEGLVLVDLGSSDGLGLDG